MRVAVIRFPGSNCEEDCVSALRTFPQTKVDMVWHKETDVSSYDAMVLPGGFSHGDYLRCGAIARLSPVMASVIEESKKGKLILGICNGFQILCETRLLPGALIRNRKLRFVCKDSLLRVENADTPFTNQLKQGDLLRLPIAHGEGCYYADADTLAELNQNQQILLRYVDTNGQPSDAANPNGSCENIAGICNAQRNIFGLMPHPERVCETLLGGTDGRSIFESMLATLTKDTKI